jgi:hypothetical protein
MRLIGDCHDFAVAELETRRKMALIASPEMVEIRRGREVVIGRVR